ncbi:MAG: carboxypeptidase-like regulatory domain-containing protein [Ignavibacteriales bacterium]|nr:carboxypeptidase-like regulatory domain-containing protein [Ignavibacteriales bacterium]
MIIKKFPFTVNITSAFFYIARMLVLIFLITFFHVNCSDASQAEYSNPTIISGIVKNTEGQPVGNSKVTLSTAPDFEGAFTDDNGIFQLKNFSAGKHKLKVQHIGYNDFEADVPSANNGTSSLYPVLSHKTYDIPSVKPLSKGKVRVRNKILETDFDGDGIYTPYIVKGAAFSPTPIGDKPYLQGIDDRSVQLLKAMNGNTFRTYSGVGKYLLTKAAENNVRVIVSFWVQYGYDFSDINIRKQIVDEFSQMVLDLKDYPAVLMWNIGNEQNYQNGNTPNWYTLIQELAIAAYKIEGETYHPVCGNNGSINNIGNASLNADDASLTYMDLWASNIYEWDIASKISEYKKKSQKAIVVTEWGIDALDNRNKKEYEDVQASFDSTNWVQISSSSDVCVGGTVFEFTDEWWKGGTPDVHDFGGYETGAHPDGYSNEEWWGIIATTPDNNNDGMDEWRLRKAYYMFQRNWK